MVKHKVKISRKTKSSTFGWPQVIAYAEGRLRQAKRKVEQIEALIASFRTQAADGEPSPMELAGLKGREKQAHK